MDTKLIEKSVELAIGGKIEEALQVFKEGVETPYAKPINEIMYLLEKAIEKCTHGMMGAEKGDTKFDEIKKKLEDIIRIYGDLPLKKGFGQEV